MIYAVALLVVATLALGIGLLFAKRRRAAPAVVELPAPPASHDWTAGAGSEFTNLPEAERCDLIFALAALDDAASKRLLERALDDPSEVVALAAARALAKLGQAAALDGYLAAHPNERARRISQTLELLEIRASS
jgi:HEAT repeat protein